MVKEQQMSHGHEVVKHVADGGAGVTYLASLANIVIEVVNPLLTTVGLVLAIVWWVYRIRESKLKIKEKGA